MTQRNLTLFFTALFVSTPFWVGANLLQEGVENTALSTMPSAHAYAAGAFVAPLANKENTVGEEIEARAAGTLVINSRTMESRFLEKKNIHEMLPIASLTKLMTALIVWENAALYRPHATTTVSAKAAGRDNVPVHGNLKEGDEVTVEYLLHLMITYSSNDAAYALAEIMGEELFTETMNEKARGIGLRNTRFADPTGLSPLNTSTVRDLALLGEHLLKDAPALYDLSREPKRYAVPHGVDAFEQDEYTLIGGKTGYLDEAGGCLFIVTRKDDNYFIHIILGSTSSQERVVQMHKLISLTY